MPWPARERRGPSPRVRGSHGAVATAAMTDGSIPARAGEPGEDDGSATVITGPSPRVRGSRRTCCGRSGSGAGPSPRVRGSPACATPRDPCRASRVHPRACGGALRPRRARPVGSSGSIPARAGEPWRRRRSDETTGPSPRVRGSQTTVDVTDRWHRGSIPARAGEPCPADGQSSRIGSIPARAGEPGRSPRCVIVSRGPSPRVRGSRRIACHDPGSRRVHPRACGGACCALTQQWHRWVHPRACGGASRTSARAAGAGGPSPRVRGSPRVPVRTVRSRRVHPRACGGASVPKMGQSGGVTSRLWGSVLSCWSRLIRRGHAAGEVKAVGVAEFTRGCAEEVQGLAPGY